MRSLPRGLGCGIPHQGYQVNAAVLDNALEVLQPDWFHTWLFDQMDHPNFFPTLWRCSYATAEYSATFNAAVTAAQGDPERLWFLGNEPERTDQSNTTPLAFGRAARRFRRLLPDTPIALPGVMLTMRKDDPGFEWLTVYHRLVLQGKALKPDYLHYHNYSYVWEQWRDIHNRARDWCRDAGWPDLLIVTETAYAGQNEVSAASLAGNLEIMQRVKAALKVSDVRAAAWMSSTWHDWPGPASDLLTTAGDLTPIGRSFVG